MAGVASSDGPVFVVGTARSGTSLTYSLLMTSETFPVYQAESRIVEGAIRYGSLRSAGNRRRFLRDFLRSRQFARSGLTESEVSRLLDRTRGSYLELLEAFMEAVCERQGKRRWAEKSPNNAFAVEELATYFPTSRFVHVVRDGRAVALSQRKLGWGEKYSGDERRQLLWIGNIWDLQVRAAQRAARLGPDRYLEIRYEDLVREFPQSLQRLASFAGVEVDPARAEESDVGTLGRTNTAFGEESSGGVTASAVDRWKSALDDEERALLDWQLGDRLEALGYELGGAPAGWRPTAADRTTAKASRWALVAKRWLNGHTLVGRFARKPLEIGLT